MIEANPVYAFPFYQPKNGWDFLMIGTSDSKPQGDPQPEVDAVSNPPKGRLIRAPLATKAVIALTDAVHTDPDFPKIDATYRFGYRFCNKGAVGGKDGPYSSFPGEACQLEDIFSLEGLTPGEKEHGHTEVGQVTNERLSLLCGHLTARSSTARVSVAMDATQVASSCAIPDCDGTWDIPR